jgi:photosystem II stability/assembly factor-like uncharacterized protein
MIEPSYLLKKEKPRLWSCSAMNRFAIAPFLLVLCVPAAFGDWHKQLVPTTADFRGLCVVSANVIWASGTKGTYLRTVDAGKTWAVGMVPSADKLDFRDVEAFGENTAYLLSAGPGEESRIYKTTDGGETWKLQFKNTDPKGFFDAIAFWDENNGIASGDPIEGSFQLIATSDGGENWKHLPISNLPPALPKEGAFAASGTCLVTQGDKDAWFATGGAKAARIFHSTDRGRTWTVSETPIQSGVESAGIFGIAFRDRQHGMIVGGDYRKPNAVGATAAVTADGGQTWSLLENKLPFRSGIAAVKDRWIAVGTSGSHSSQDNGRTWQSIDRENYNTVGCSPTGEIWAAGPKGRVAKYER